MVVPSNGIPDPGSRDAQDASRMPELAAAALSAVGCCVHASDFVSVRLHHDVLTGLPGHAPLRARLEQELQRAELCGGQVLVASLDLARFTRLNAYFGHEQGDCLLRLTARRLECGAGPGATVSRLDSDKFVVVRAIANSRDAIALAHTLVAEVSHPHHIDGHELSIGCRVGLALYPEDGSTTEALLFAAAGALAAGKSAGAGVQRAGGAVRHGAQGDRLRLASALRQALAEDTLALYYQPQLDLVSGRITGVEALLRWNHPQRGMLDASEVVALAEDAGLIVPLGAWVLRQACRQVQAWHQMGHAGLRAAVNLSARQFAEPGLEAMVAATLSETGLPPAFLDLELTETLLMSDRVQTAETLHALRALGVRMSLDDFGTGSSNLSNLQRLPISSLKIDRSFLHDLPQRADGIAIADAIISMAHSLGMRVVAEGVETELQCELMSRHMCDEIQGHYFAPALAAEQLQDMLEQGRQLPSHLLRLHKPRPTLLLVDDEPNILSSLRRLLRGDGYQIFTATSADAGLALLAEHSVDVIVSDQRMPGKTGVEFLRLVKASHPETVRIVLSGFTELKSVTDAVNAGAIYKFLTKPWDDEQLRGHIAEAFAYRAMENDNRLLGLEVSTANQQLAVANRQLEELLTRQKCQIARGELSLDIVRAALNNVPVGVLAADDEGMLVLVNRAAEAMFPAPGLLLGVNVAQLFAAFPPLEEAVTRGVFDTTVAGRALRVFVKFIGDKWHANGYLISVIDCASLYHAVAPDQLNVDWSCNVG